MKLKLIILFSTVSLISYGQNNAWYKHNDSAIQKAIAYYSEYCAPLSSSKKVNKKQIRRDKKIIESVNRLYSVSTIDSIKYETRMFSADNIYKDTVMPIYLYLAKGNLRVIFQAAELNHVLVKKRLVIATNTKISCEKKYECCLSYFDFIYIKDYLLNAIKFPISFKPGTVELVFEQSSP